MCILYKYHDCKLLDSHALGRRIQAHDFSYCDGKPNRPRDLEVFGPLFSLLR